MNTNAEVPPYKFDVFLSYSRKDEKFAKQLEDALENYRLPKDVKTSIIQKNRLTVFRDKHDLVPTDGDYWKTIEEYLARSAYLIIICSPNARGSQYVDHEVRTFLKSHEAKSLIPVLLSGRPNNEQHGKLDEYAFPEALCGALAMPLAVEFTQFDRAPGKVNKGRYRDSWYTLLAKIFGAERAEIERQDARRQARRRAVFAGIAISVTAVLTVALIIAVISRQEAVKQREEAIHQRDQARRLLYASDVNLAQRAFDSGNVGLGDEVLKSYLSRPADQEELRGFEWYYLWRLYNRQFATFEQTDDIDFSSEGKSFVTAALGTVRLWDAGSLRETATVKIGSQQSNAGSGRVARVSFAPDGRTVAYGDDEKIVLVDIASKSLQELPLPAKGKGGDRDFWELARGGTPRFSPDGKLLAVSYMCGLVAVYDAHLLNQTARLGDGPPASFCSDFVTFSSDSRLLAYGDGYNVRLWDTFDRRDLGGPSMDVSLSDAVGQVEAVAFSPDGKLLAIGDRSKQIVLWNVSTRKVVGRLKGHEAFVSSLAFSSDSKVLYSGSMDKTVKLWDFSAYKGDGRISGDAIRPFATIKGHTNWISGIRSSPAGNIVATVGADQRVKLWTNSAAAEFNVINDVEGISESANFIAVPSGERLKLTLFDLRTGVPVQAGTVTGLNPTLSPDGKILATASSAGRNGAPTIKLWNVSPLTELATIQGQSSVFSADGRLFMALSPDSKSILLWDTLERKQLPPIQNDAVLKNFLLSADGTKVLTVDKEAQRAKLWDASRQSQLGKFEKKNTRQSDSKLSDDEEQWLLTMSPDGKLVASADSKELVLWETNSTSEPFVLEKVQENVTALLLSSDGKFLVSGSDSGIVKIWDNANRKVVSSFRAHKDAVTAIAFSPDHRTLATGGADGIVKLYSTASNRELITLGHEPSATSEIHVLQGGEDSILEVFFSADGKSLITISANQVLRIWRAAADAAGSASRN